MKQIVSFDKLKLTNNLLDDNGHVSSRAAGDAEYHRSGFIFLDAFRVFFGFWFLLSYFLRCTGLGNYKSLEMVREFSGRFNVDGFFLHFVFWLQKHSEYFNTGRFCFSLELDFFFPGGFNDMSSLMQG